MRQEIEKITDLLHHTFEGSPWHGLSVLDIIEDVSAEQALRRLHAGTHNICELVRHMTNWRTFAIEKLKGNPTFDIALNTAADWPVVDTLAETNWQQYKDNLRHTQQQLLDLLAMIPDTRLDDIVGGRKYSFRVLLYGIIQHDTYHQGQIALVRKAEE